MVCLKNVSNELRDDKTIATRARIADEGKVRKYNPQLQEANGTVGEAPSRLATSVIF